MGADDLLRLAATGLGVPHCSDKATSLQGVAEVLRAQRSAGRRCLLVVDEVQALNLPALEELRLLSNIAEGGRSLLQAVLLGQTEFRRTLASPELDQLRQRVLASYPLGPLTAQETRAYVEHRLRAVGWRERPAWEDDAFGLVHQFTNGVPRRINRLCGRVLLHGAFDRSDAISAEMVRVTASELQQDLGSCPAAREAATSSDPDLLSRVEALERTVARRERIFTRLFDLLEDRGGSS